MGKVTHEVAQNEINSWLDKKKVFASIRDANKESIENLVEAVVEGVLTLDSSSFELTQILLFPLGEGGVTKSLVYKARLNDNLLKPHLKNVELKDLEGRFAAMTAALTGETKGVYLAMDTADTRITKSILVFFL